MEVRTITSKLAESQRIHTSWIEAWINCLASSATQTLIILRESSSLKMSLPSFRAPNFLKTGKELSC